MPANEENKSNCFRGFKKLAEDYAAARAAEPKLPSVYDAGDIDKSQLQDIYQRILGLEISVDRRKSLLEWAIEFYEHCRRGEPVNMREGQIISLHALDPSPQAREKYFEELVKLDPATEAGQKVVDHFANSKDELTLAELNLKERYGKMYEAVKTVKAARRVSPLAP